MDDCRSRKRAVRQWQPVSRREAEKGFPEKVTAFHDAMAVHGRYGKPCYRCGLPIEVLVGRNDIVYVDGSFIQWPEGTQQ